MARPIVNLMCRYFEDVWNRGNLRCVDDRLARDWVGHAPGMQIEGPERLKEHILAMRAARPGLNYAIELAIADADRVAVRWRAAADTLGPGASAGTAPAWPITGMTFARFADGKIVESWAEGVTLAVL